MNSGPEMPIVLFAAKTSIVLIAAWIIHFGLAKANPRWRVFVWRVSSVGVAGLLIAAAVPPLYTVRIPASYAGGQYENHQSVTFRNDSPEPSINATAEMSGFNWRQHTLRATPTAYDSPQHHWVAALRGR